jgi:hypothetical protein
MAHFELFCNQPASGDLVGSRQGSEQLGQGEALDVILGFTKRCDDISDRRNDLLHSPIARERDGQRF